MMAPPPRVEAQDDAVAGPPLRLVVRSPSGRMLTYEVGGSEFLLGSAEGCDLRVPALDLPPVAAQILRRSDGAYLRRLNPSARLWLNGRPLAAQELHPLQPGDRLLVGDVAIDVVFPAAVVAPRFIPWNEPEQNSPTPASDNSLTANGTGVSPEEAASPVRVPTEEELIRRARELDRQAEELEADRVLWYQRREQIQKELEEQRRLIGLLGVHKGDLDQRERELNRQREILTQERQRLEAQRQYQEQLWQQRQRELDEREQRWQQEWAERIATLESLRQERERLRIAFEEWERLRRRYTEEQQAWEQEREAAQAELTAERQRLQDWEERLRQRAADLDRMQQAWEQQQRDWERTRQQFHEDLLLLERRAAAVEQREAKVQHQQTELTLWRQQLRQEAEEWAETVRLAAEEQQRLQQESERLQRWHQELEQRTAALAQLQEQLEAQQAALTAERLQIEESRRQLEREAAQLVALQARQAELSAQWQQRWEELERQRQELAQLQASTTQQKQQMAEQDALLAAAWQEVDRQRQELQAQAEQLRQRQAELDSRSAEIAEQAGALKGRLLQALALHERLEMDRQTLREREAALAAAEQSRLALQEQLRRRAEELHRRSQELDELAQKLTAERQQLAQQQEELHRLQQEQQQHWALREQEWSEREQLWQKQQREWEQREQSLQQRFARLREAGANLAAARKNFARNRAAWEAERQQTLAQIEEQRQQLLQLQEHLSHEWTGLQQQAPEIARQMLSAQEQLEQAREVVRQHLGSFHSFAAQHRQDLEALRTALRLEAERLQRQEQELQQARAEHRLAVTAFRQQLLDWQAQIAEMKRLLSGDASRLEAQEAQVRRAAEELDAATRQLAEQQEQLRQERQAVAQKRAELERHLNDMREWYRHKLRELAANSRPNSAAAFSETDRLRILPAETSPSSSSVISPSPSLLPTEEVEPGDRQLGELLLQHQLVDPETIRMLWDQAARQRRTLRQVLLQSGVLTLYQLALIEAGQLDGLILGRFRVLDRLRTTPRETLYRVCDPQVPEPGGNVFLLRHLSEAEMEDAVHPDEFRQRFTAVQALQHPHVAAVREVLEIQGRPAALLDWPTGLFSPDWPASAGDPGCWLRLLTQAASGLTAAHQHGLVHGHLTADSLLLTPDGVVKIVGLGEPPWLWPGPTPSVEPSPSADLRALGQIAATWTLWYQSPSSKRQRPRTFPEELLQVLRRLEADPMPPMADMPPAHVPYASAAELLADLHRLASRFPCSEEVWHKLVQFIAEQSQPAGVHQGQWRLSA
ncbi:hypothetical protein [Thermogemmata fonticola]|uniref:FHA domain-containing protein n=1 Tax=Thermogemmata fonticola TaxID=2755323 RepID=A0A7V8VC18_9BACT|nr:hypothetical protein [Thermogemmata fonticola]MBA2224982.1 hypothetical protein [Thermogemmata fonticola]